MSTSTTDADLLETVQEHGPLASSDDARETVAATMETFGERITDGQAEDLAATLPEVAAEPLREGGRGEAESFSLPAFLTRIAERRGDGDEDPAELARSVLLAVRDAADAAELERAREQLPRDFDLVFEPGRPMETDEFLELVAADLPADVDPREATDATLETLGDRLTGGQAGDLATYLPQDLRSALTTGEDAEPLDREAFLEHVTERGDVDEDDAPAVVRAVTGALAETAATAELENVRSQLPEEFEPVLAFEGGEE